MILNNYNFILFLFLVITIMHIPNAFSQEDKNQVTISNGAYSPLCAKTSTCYVPSNLIIESGEIVEWVNGDYAPHTITSGNIWAGKDHLFESEILNHLEKFEFTFSGFEPGTYSYYCIIHPWMTGIISIDVYEIPFWKEI